MSIKIIPCWCTELKLREPSVGFYTDTKFYSAVKEVFVAPCKRHPLFKNRFADLYIEMSCKCLLQDAGRCTNCKAKCFTQNFLANKLKLLLESVPDSVKLKPMDEYLKKDVEGILLRHFCKHCTRIVCSIDNPDEKEFLKGKKVWGN